MGAPKKPTALKIVQGTDKKNPNRMNHNEPVPTNGVGPAPSKLTPIEKEIWDEVVGISYKGVMGEGDRIALEIMVRLIAEMRADYITFTAAKITQLSQLLGRFGMTPSDRTKISVPKGTPKNGFESL